MNLKAFGAKLRQLREAAGLSQKALAEKAGLSQKAISHWEVGQREPGMAGALALAKALGVSVEVLGEGTEDVPEVKRGRPRKGKPAGQDEPKKPRKGKSK